VVWQDYRNGNWDIFMFDLGTGTETQITDDPAPQTSPVISGERVVWSGDHGYGGLYLLDLTTGVERQLTSDMSGAPTIEGDWIVWINLAQEGRIVDKLHFFDLATNTETELGTENLYWFSGSAISGARIAFGARKYTGFKHRPNADLYLFELSTDVIELLMPIRGTLEDFVLSGQVESGTAEPLHALLVQASASVVKGSRQSAVNSLVAFINLVSAQSGKDIVVGAAETLISLASSAISELGV
jgi:beta propeller repeat protein